MRSLIDPTRPDRPAPPTPAATAVRRLVAPLALLVAAAAPLGAVLAARDRLPSSPPVTDPAQLAEWWVAGEPIDAVAGIATSLVVVILAYLCVVAAAAALGAIAPGSVAARLARTCTPRILGAVLAGTVALGHGATASAADGPPPAPTDPGAGATMRVVGSPERSTVGDVTPGPARGPTPARPRTSLPWSARTVPAPDAATAFGPAAPVPTSPVPAPPAATVDATPLAPSTAGDDGERTHTVAPGDHLWSIAEQVLAAVPGRDAVAPPSDDEVARYWRRLITANRERLLDPDLILPGQVLVLPPTGEAADR